MASGPIVGGVDGAKEKQRYTENKVYTRKAFKGPKNKVNALNAVAPSATTAPTTTTTNNGNNNDEPDKNENNVLTHPPQRVSEDGNATQPQVNSRFDVVSDDSSSLPQRQDEPSSLNCLPVEPSSLHCLPVEPSSLHCLPVELSSINHPQDVTPSTRNLPTGNGVVKPGLENRVEINAASRSKREVRDLRKKLENELDKVRSLIKRVEEKQGQIGGYRHSNVSLSDGVDNGVGVKRIHSEVAPISVPREPTRPLHQLSVQVLENSPGVTESIEREKRTPKANQLYRNSEFLLGKDKFPPAESNKKSKLNGKKHGGVEMGHGFDLGSKFFKSCSSLLEKLMKHKHGWVFNAPVDVEALGLHDYFSIITHPMDLGTVKSRLNKNWYKSPKEFAEDVRLTFRNAMTYNPKGQDVHVMAELLSNIFEDRWAIIESDYNREIRYGVDYGSALPARSPMSKKTSSLSLPPLDMRRILDRSESMPLPPRSMSITPVARTPAPKKPKAKDPHKRDMTYEEKQKLSANLQGLPSEKLDTIVQIIKKRHSALFQDDDEIEVDIDSVDAETLWELDRFVTNYKKSLSKNKRKAELANQARTGVGHIAAMSQAPIRVDVAIETRADERSIPTSLPLQGVKPVDNGSRSSSSSSSSSDSGSSSSDSDSDSSSASGSDAGSPRT